MLSLVVITNNEEDRLSACLASVPFADEIWVRDSGSTDDTVQVARRAGAHVVQTDWPGHVAQKNRVLALATQPWVLSLDADERLSAAAGASLVGAMAAPGDAIGFRFPRLSSWLGMPIRHGRWYPDRKLRVVRRGEGTWMGDDPHDQLVCSGPTTLLEGDLLHEPYRDLAEHFSTIDRYTAISARTLYARGRRAHLWDVGLRGPLHFVDAYLLRRGFLDGGAGLAVAGLGAVYSSLKWSRLWRLQRGLE